MSEVKYDHISALPPNIDKDVPIYIDTETTGLDYTKDKPFCVPISVLGQEYVLPWDDMTIMWLEEYMPCAKYVGGYHLKYDIHMMRNGGLSESIVDRTNFMCGMLREQLINEHRLTYSLDEIALERVGEGKETGLFYKLAELFGGEPDESQMKNVSRAPIEIVIPYAKRDAKITRGVIERQHYDIESQELERVQALEMDVLKTLVDIEKRGCPLDEEARHKAKLYIRDLIDIIDEELTAMVGYRINVNSPKDMVYAFDVLNLPYDKAKPSFDKEVLSGINHPFGEKALEMRLIMKLKDTFTEGADQFIKPDGAIHTTFNQLRGDEYGTGTGRLSSSKPNMQQIPKRNKRAAEIIRGFFAKKGHKWLSRDWEQFEFRIAAHYWDDPKIKKAFKDNPASDFHQMVADLAKIRRSPEAKQTNLGLVFGMGKGKMAYMIGFPVKQEIVKGKLRYISGPEGEKFFAHYHATFPSIEPFLKRATALAEQRGYVRSIYGRRLRFPRGKATHKAGGLIFQSTSADKMKEKLVEMNREFKTLGNGAELVLPIHDEFNALTPEGTEQQVSKVMQEIMETMSDIKIPILSKGGIGNTWWEACT